MPVGSHFENPCSRRWRSCLTFLHYPKALAQCLANLRHVNDYWMIPIPAWPSMLAQKAMSLRLLQAIVSEPCDPSDLMRAKRKVTKSSVLEMPVDKHEGGKWLHRFLPLFFFNKFIYFIYLFLAALGLRCCTRAFSSCVEQGLLFVVVRGLLLAVASLVAEHGLLARGLQ